MSVSLFPWWRPSSRVRNDSMRFLGSTVVQVNVMSIKTVAVAESIRSTIFNLVFLKRPGAISCQFFSKGLDHPDRPMSYHR